MLPNVSSFTFDMNPGMKRGVPTSGFQPGPPHVCMSLISEHDTFAPLKGRLLSYCVLRRSTRCTQCMIKNQEFFYLFHGNLRFSSHEEDTAQIPPDRKPALCRSSEWFWVRKKVTIPSITREKIAFLFICIRGILGLTEYTG